MLVLVFDLGEELAGFFLRGFARGDADGLAGGQVDKGGGHLAPVAELKGSLAKAAAGDDGDSIGSAAVNLYKGDETFAVCAARIFDAKPLAPEHGHAHAEDLASAEVAVGDLGFFEEMFEEKSHRDKFTLAACVVA